MPTYEAQSGDTPPRPGASRPSLMGAGPAGDARHASILQALQRTGGGPSPSPAAAPAAPARGAGWLVLAMGAAVSMVALAWALRPSFDDGASSDAAPQPRGAQAPVVAVAPPSAAPMSRAEPAATGTGTGTSVPVPEPASSAARIETLAPPVATQQQTGEPAPPAPAPAAVAAAVPRAAAAPPGAGPDIRPARKTTETAEGTRPPATAGVRRSQASASTPRASPSPPAGAPARVDTAPSVRTTAASTARRDSDVDIVTALMTHIDGAAAAAASRPASPPSAATRTRGNAPQPAVAADVPDNIADLVASCRGAADRTGSLACRARICKGYWGKAEACPSRDRRAAERAARARDQQGQSIS